MTRAPFILIDGRLYRWKDILELRRAQLAARRSRTSKPDGVICNLARRPPTAERGPSRGSGIPRLGGIA